MAGRLVLGLSALACAFALDIKVANKGGNATSGLQYGIMFEDINQSGDGGIYAELIRNRAFQGSTVYPTVIEPWTALGGAKISLKNLTQPLSSALPTSLNVAASKGTVGISNPGYWGIDVRPQKYTGSFWVKGNYKGSFQASFYNYLSKKTVASVRVPSKATANEWTEHKFTLVPGSKAGVNNTFQITFDASGAHGSLDFNLISVFPPTYNNRPNGFRPELMEAVKALNPSFFRLPGGNNLEGNANSSYYWKWYETIGPLKNRPGYPGTWNYENTNGLGLIEYMQWCDDLNAEPVLAVWGGYYLGGPAIAQDQLQPYIDEALDELEFLMGDASTKYGKLRTSLGYPKPWTIKYVEVGNEDNLGTGGPSYQAYRFQMFKDAINKKYPEIFVFASAPDWDFAETEDAGEDFHEYTRPDRFVSQFGYFDHAATGFKTMIGEYATIQGNIAGGGGVNWTAPRMPWPIWVGSVAEAVFLLGAERNSDKIFGAAYAPMLQNLNSYQWAPDLISYSADPDLTVHSTSHHMISLLGGTRITQTLPIASPTYDPAFYVAGYSNATNSYILKTAVYNATSSVPMKVSFEGVSKGASATLTVLSAPDGLSHNEPGTDIVKKKVTQLKAGKGGVVEFELEKLSISVLEVKPR